MHISVVGFCILRVIHWHLELEPWTWTDVGNFLSDETFGTNAHQDRCYRWYKIRFIYLTRY